MSTIPTAIIRVRRPGSKLTRVDFLLIVAILLVFVVTAATHHLTFGQKNGTAPISADLPDGTGYLPSDDSLLKARIGFARGIGT
jgi:hypothetical protein